MRVTHASRREIHAMPQASRQLALRRRPMAAAAKPAMIMQPLCGLIRCASALRTVSALHSSCLVDSPCPLCCAGFVRARSSEAASLSRGWCSSARTTSSTISSACIEPELNATTVRRRYPCASPRAHLERNHDAFCVPLPPALKPDLLAPDARAPYPLCQLTSGCASSTPWQSQNARVRRHCASRAPFRGARQRGCSSRGSMRVHLVCFAPWPLHGARAMPAVA